MIPKIIHYCWFGNKKKPKLVRDCILSWKKFLPDYQIIEWNEKNTDLSHPFVKEAYDQKKWAFVSDYVRLNVMYEKGGIYLDTDMMVLKSFDDLLHLNCFIGTEDLYYINVAVIGAIPKNIFIKGCLELYDKINLTINNNFNEITIPKLITKKFRELYFFESNFEDIIIKESVKIYPSHFFYPFPYEKKNDLKNYKNYIKTTSYTVHLWNSSWIEYSEFHYFRNSEYKKGLQKTLSKLIQEKKVDLTYLRKIVSAIKESHKNKR